jgi:dihydrofolate reductase
MNILVLNHVSLDGVMQAPGRPDEDTRGGFAHGGWAIAGGDPVMTEWIGPVGTGSGGGMLLGRRSYEDMLSAWNRMGGPFKDALNAAPKYVASSSSSTNLEWPNSTLLHGDIPAAVEQLKRRGEGQLLIMGSAVLIHSLLPYNLIDEYRLAIHPLLLGGGVRLFPDGGAFHPLTLVDSRVTTTGVILATYAPAA